MIAKYGSGRVKPVWAERLGKKYYWIIARRLLGILCDNVDKRRVAWEDSVNPSIPLLQGIDMRDIDPTDLRPKNEGLPLSFDWWSHAYYEFGATQRLKHAEWLSLSDFPNLFAILRILDQQGTGWVHLSLTRSQRTKRAKDKQNEYPYRNLTTLATSVFVPSRDLEDIQRLLSNKQFSPMMDSYTPEVYRLFLGEYPKTIAYDQLLGGAIDLSLDFPGTDQAALTHCVLRGGKSWEIRISSDSNPSSLYVPSPDIIRFGKLKWNQGNSWKSDSGDTLAANIDSDTGSGLLIDGRFLRSYLESNSLTLVFICYQEKYLVTLGHGNEGPTSSGTEDGDCIRRPGSHSFEPRVGISMKATSGRWS